MIYGIKEKSILLIMVFDWVFRMCLRKEKSVVGETLVEDTEEVSSTEETKALRKKLQNSGKRAMDFQWMNRRKRSCE